MGVTSNMGEYQKKVRGFTRQIQIGALIVAAIMVVVVVLTLFPNEEMRPTAPPTEKEIQPITPPTEPKEEIQPTVPPTETLGEILGRGVGISSVKYDMVMTAQGMPSTTQKVWLKKNKMRTEMTVEGQTMVSLIDMGAKTMYTYMPELNMAMKVDFGGAPKSPTESIEKYKPVVIGTETIDGKVCIVVEYTAEGVKTKSWIWKEKGFPIRVEMTTPEGKMIVEYKNIQFVDIPDSMFVLPAGVQIMEMPIM